LNNFTDIELARDISRGDNIEKAFNEFYDRYQAQVFTLVKYLVYDKSSAEDIFQEAFAGIFSALRKGKAMENPAGYLMNAARNLCYKFNRDRKIYPDIDSVPEPGETVDYSGKDLIQKIKKYVFLLEEKYREIFILKEFLGYKHEEIAKICDISVSTSKIRLFRAHKKLQDYLNPYIKELEKHG
jgi:RNA polymerase sigma factor (sigma-70 family)